jgi:transcriptional regulator with XRE-family HTH domain
MLRPSRRSIHAVARVRPSPAVPGSKASRLLIRPLAGHLSSTIVSPSASSQRSLGDFIRDNRRLLNLSLRDLSSMTNVSNAYLSQVERNLHQPSIRVLRAIADALELSSEQMMAYAGLTRDTGEPHTADGDEIDTESAIMQDPSLDPTDRQTLLALYRRLTGRSNAT